MHGYGARFNVGDVVRLKSGGPKMTVDDVFQEGNMRCQWFAGSKLEYGVFPAASLEPAGDDALPAGGR